MEKNNLKAFLSNNPVTVLFLSACPALASTTSVISGLTISGAVFCILLLSSLVMALLGKITETYIRLPLSVIITAGFASMANMVIAAFLPSPSSMLGVYVALCAINAMVVLKGVVASDSGVGEAVKTAVICGLEFAALVIVMAVLRVTLGLLTAQGGFIVFSVLLAISNCFSKDSCCSKEAK